MGDICTNILKKIQVPSAFNLSPSVIAPFMEDSSSDQIVSTCPAAIKRPMFHPIGTGLAAVATCKYHWSSKDPLPSPSIGMHCSQSASTCPSSKTDSPLHISHDMRYVRVDISAGRFALMAKAVTFTSTTTVATRVMLST